MAESTAEVTVSAFGIVIDTSHCYIPKIQIANLRKRKESGLDKIKLREEWKLAANVIKLPNSGHWQEAVQIH